MTTSVEVTVRPGTGKFDPDDRRWRDQVAALHALLGEEAGPVSLRRIPASRAKGAVDSAILALGSSGALTASVACFRAWLKRDKTRTLTVTWTDESGGEQTATVTGDNLDETSFQALVQAISRRLGSG